jgi:hypothetical protein
MARSLIEFDLRWSDDINDFWVFHDCLDGAANNSLDFFLAQINASTRSNYGITFVYFDSGNVDGCVFYPSIVNKPADWPDRLQTKLTANWGSRVYTQGEFVAIDNQKWPSAQELLRRGKNLVVIVNQVFGNSYFFAVDSASPNYVFVQNTSAEDTPITASDLGDKFVARHYPSCGFTCNYDACSDGWAWGVNNNYTFPASNCSNRAFDRLHPPLPTYVCCPAGTGIIGRGSYNNAYNGPSGVIDAVARAQAHQDWKGASVIEIRISAGTYSAPPRISATVKLVTNAGETVRLQ